MDLNFQRVKTLSYIEVQNFFTAEELKHVTKEINDLKRFLLPPDKTNTAVKKGETQKNGTGVFLDRLYENERKNSAILTANRKIFNTEFLQKAEEFDSVFNFIRLSNKDITLLNSYNAGQEYKTHYDKTRITCLVFLREGEFEGGEFCFPTQGITMEASHNKAVLFPSCTLHGSFPVTGEGTRFSIAQFIDHV